jgi:hypothetical protein
LSRGSSPAGYPAEPLVSYQINRQLSGWNLPPLVIRAFGAHCQQETYAPQQTASLFNHFVGAAEQRARISMPSPVSDGGSEPLRPFNLALQFAGIFIRIHGAISFR